MPRDVSLSDSKCWNGGHEWVKRDNHASHLSFESVFNSCPQIRLIFFSLWMLVSLDPWSQLGNKSSRPEWWVWQAHNHDAKVVLPQASAPAGPEHGWKVADTRYQFFQSLRQISTECRPNIQDYSSYCRSLECEHGTIRVCQRNQGNERQASKAK